MSAENVDAPKSIKAKNGPRVDTSPNGKIVVMAPLDPRATVIGGTGRAHKHIINFAAVIGDGTCSVHDTGVMTKESSHA